MGLWLVLVVMLMSMALVLREGERYLASGLSGQQNAAYQLFVLAWLVVLFLVVRGLTLLKPLAIRASIGLFSMVAAWHAYLFLLILINQKIQRFDVLAVLVVPPAFAGWYLARPSLLDLARRYSCQRERNAMERHVRKQLLKRR